MVDDVVAPRTPVRLECDRPHRCAGDGEDRVGVVPAHEGSDAVDAFAGTLRGVGGGLAGQHNAGSRERRHEPGAEDARLREGAMEMMSPSGRSGLIAVQRLSERPDKPKGGSLERDGDHPRGPRRVRPTRRP